MYFSCPPLQKIGGSDWYKRPCNRYKPAGRKTPQMPPDSMFFLFIFEGRFGTIMVKKNASQTPTDFFAIQLDKQSFFFWNILAAHNHHPILIGRRTTTSPCFESPDHRKCGFFQVRQHMFIPVSYQSCVPCDMESGEICPSETRNEFIMKSTLLYQKHGKQASKNRLVSVLFSRGIRAYQLSHKMGFKRP